MRQAQEQQAIPKDLRRPSSKHPKKDQEIKLSNPIVVKMNAQQIQEETDLLENDPYYI